VATQGAHRKTVTVLFCDLAGSTALGETIDPERLRALLARYFERMQAIVTHHGGSVEKFIGDAVMAVFGVPAVHEDDALRACRAAIEMRDALPELGLEGRIGVMTGEVVTGTEERLATGDAVNVAARLEQAAPPGDVLIGEATLSLVRDATDVEPVEPLTLKGKVEPVLAYRLLRVRDVSERRHEARFVGRQRELDLLLQAWERTRDESRCELVTVIGEAGVGKSRLAAEFVARVDAKVARGRCLPYGDGITYWPVVEVLKQLDLLPTDEAAAVAIRSLLRESDAPTTPEEIAWAFRKTLEHAAAERPLVVLFDDVQWGEDMFRDLIEHIALLSTGAPILLFCLARPELVERHPTWPLTLRAEPLAADDVDRLIPDDIPGGLRERIGRTAGGNPLFVQEIVAMARAADGDVVVPPTLQALLAARLDQLEPAERSVLERGAIEGEIFHRGAVQALSPDETHVTPRLAALVRKQLIQPDQPQLAGEDGFRFRHILIRDAAYNALPKATRTDLHARLAAWLEEVGVGLVELDELVGYHLEQAVIYRTELGLPDDAALATAAREHLAAGGYRAARRQDHHAAVRLFERAARMTPDDVDLALETELAEVLLWTGRAADACRRADEAAVRAAARGDRIGEATSRIRAGVLRMYIEPEAVGEKLSTFVEEVLPMFEAAGDDMALFVAYSALGEVADTQGRSDTSLEAWERAFAHAQRAGHDTSTAPTVHAYLRFVGTTPVTELIEWLDANEPSGGGDQFFRAYRAWSLAKLGQFDEARRILAVARSEQAERGGGLLLANLTSFESVWVEMLAGDPAAAAEYGAEGCKLHEELGESRFLASAAATYAQTLYALDRIDLADDWVDRAVELGASDEVWTQMLWRQVKAKILARRGQQEEAERVARDAVAICDTTEMLDFQGDVYADLAEVLVLGGKPAEAVAALEQALERYERKGNVVSAQRTRERLAELQPATRG
jgi:class 3 adenylate cyclase/tetratricopeptide (TPR) repeat protein